jgi:hypothetical protein
VTARNLAEAFTIFAGYPGADDVSAEHDVLFAGPDPAVVSAEHTARLEELGWFTNSEFDCFSYFT